MSDGRSTALTRSRDRAIEKAGGVETLYGWIEGGETLMGIAGRLGLDTNDAASKSAVLRVLSSDPERYEAAKRASVDSIAEKANTFDRGVPESSAEAAHNRDESGYWRWLADMRAGRNEGVNINLNVGDPHLRALKMLGSPQRVRATQEFEDAGKEPVGPEYEKRVQEIRLARIDKAQAVDADYEIEEDNDE